MDALVVQMAAAALASLSTPVAAFQVTWGHVFTIAGVMVTGGIAAWLKANAIHKTIHGFASTANHVRGRTDEIETRVEKLEHAQHLSKNGVWRHP